MEALYTLVGMFTFGLLIVIVGIKIEREWTR